MPMPKVPSALFTAVVEALTSAVPFENVSGLVVKPVPPVPPFANATMPVTLAALPPMLSASFGEQGLSS